MAIIILSIPAIAAEEEQVLLGSKTTINEGRENLRMKTIEALECLKSWFWAGLPKRTQPDCFGTKSNGI